MAIVIRHSSVGTAMGLGAAQGQAAAKADRRREDDQFQRTLTLQALDGLTRAASQASAQKFQEAEREKDRVFDREMEDNRIDQRWSEMKESQRFASEENERQRAERLREFEAEQADRREYRQGQVKAQQTNAYANLARGGAAIMGQARGAIDDAAKRAEAFRTEVEANKLKMKAEEGRAGQMKLIEDGFKKQNRAPTMREEFALEILKSGKDLPSPMLSAITDIDEETGQPRQPTSAVMKRQEGLDGWKNLPSVKARYLHFLPKSQPVPQVGPDGYPVLGPDGKEVVSEQMAPAMIGGDPVAIEYAKRAEEAAEELAQLMQSTETTAAQLGSVAAEMGKAGLPPELVHPVREAYAQRQVQEHAAAAAQIEQEAAEEFNRAVDALGHTALTPDMHAKLADGAIAEVLKRHGLAVGDLQKMQAARLDPQGEMMRLAAPPPPKSPLKPADPQQQPAKGRPWWMNMLEPMPTGLKAGMRLVR